MKMKTAIAAATLALFGAAAGAATTQVKLVNDSFNDVVLGSITFASASTVSGLAGFVSQFEGTFGNQTFTFSAPAINFSRVSLYSGATESAFSTSSAFNFANLTSGTYTLKVSGSVVGGGTGGALAQYNVTPVPEPETYAMLLAGLGVMGAIARRRNKTAA